jgi:hypothetical protein
LIEIFGGAPKTQVVGISVIEPVNEWAPESTREGAVQPTNACAIEQIH